MFQAKIKNRRKHPLYDLYYTMRQRCLNPNNLSFKNYGARGIRVHESWLGEYGFEQFVQDVGIRPSLQYTLDRIDNNSDYAPGNVRWATKQIQNSNTRRNLEVIGVYRATGRASHKWRVVVRDKHIGLFDSYEEAVVCRRTYV